MLHELFCFTEPLAMFIRTAEYSAEKFPCFRYASAGVVVVPPPTKRTRAPKKTTTKLASTRPTSSTKNPSSNKYVEGYSV